MNKQPSQVGSCSSKVFIGWREMHELMVAPADLFEAALAMATQKTHSYREAGKFDRGYLRLSANLKTRAYRPIADAFITSMNRIDQMNALPLELMFQTRVTTECFCAARVASGLDPLDGSQDGAFQIEAKATEIYRTRKAVLITDQDKRLAEHEKTLEKVLERDITHISDAAYSVLAAMATSAYGAFETLAADLWVAVIDENDDLAMTYVNSIGEKSINISSLLGGGLDLRGSMGSKLLQSRKVSFQTLNDIKGLYADVFGESVVKDLTDWKSVYKTEKIRHLIAHRGGVVDAQFIEQMKNFSEFNGLKLLQRLPLDGPQVRDRINICIRTAKGLLELAEAKTTKRN